MLTSSSRRRDVIAACCALATLIVLMITTTSYQPSNRSQQTNDASIESVDTPITSHHHFHTKQADTDDVSTPSSPYQVLTRADQTKWKQVNDSSITSSLLDSSSLHTFHWIFPSRNMDWVVSQLSAVSNPSNPRYGHWM
jgi:hypothetical protein